MSTKGRVLLITSAGAFMPFLDATIVNIAFPDIEAGFPGASRAGLSWVLSAYNIVFAALLVPAGRIADAIGRRRVFLFGLALFTAASALCAAAPSAEALVAGRVAQAAGGAALIPTSLALLLGQFPIERRATAVGLWGAAAAVAASIGPSLGGVVVELADWRWIFLANLPIGALALWAGRTLPEARGSGGSETMPDFAGVALVAASIGLLALGIVQGGEWGWTDPRIVGAFAGFALLAPLFAWRSLRHPSPVVEFALFRVRSMAAGNLGTLLFAAAFYALLLGNVLFLTEAWHYSVLSAGLAVTPAPFTAALFAVPAGRLADRLGPRVVIVPGTLAFALGCLWFAFEVDPSAPSYASQWLPGAMLTGLGVGLAYPTLGSAAVAEIDEPRFGVASAVNAMVRQTGAVLGVALLIAIVGTPTPAEAPSAYDTGWLFAAIVGFSAGIAGLAIGRLGHAPATKRAAVGERPAEAAA